VTEARPEDGLLGWLDGPRLVVGAFAFFLLGLTVLGVLLWSDQRTAVQRIDSIQRERSAEQLTAKTDSVARCFSTANQGPALRRVLRGLERGADMETRLALRDFRQLNLLNAPTLRECRQLADRLNVPIPPQEIR
jgi:hypothetical protein